MWSQYMRIKEKDGVVAIFHELHPDPIYYSSEQWKKLICGSISETSVFTDDFRRRKLIVDTSEDDQREFEKVASDLEHKFNQTTILYLMTAQGCNFACEYCPVSETAKEGKTAILSLEDAIAGIDLWQAHLRESYSPDLQYYVIFYGGEPLLNKEAIRASLNYIETGKKNGDLPSELNIMIATNGILIDHEIIALCKKHDVLVAIGLDGPEAMNDALRIDSDGNGTFNRIVEVIELLVKNKIRTFASVSITPFNAGQISKYSEFFSGLGIEKFGFNFLKGRALLSLVGQNGLDDYYRIASRGIIENARQQKKQGFEYQMEKKQTAFDRRDFYPVDCTCYGNQLVIQPDGQISNCPFYKARLGNVRDVEKDFRIWDQKIIKEWRKRLSLYHPGESKALNGGGCAWSSYELKGDFSAIDDSSKIFSEEVLNELIWSRYKKL